MIGYRGMFTRAFDRQDEALGRLLRRFPAWYTHFEQPLRGIVGGLVLVGVLLMLWLEVRDAF